jgi:hypothetical protein
MTDKESQNRSSDAAFGTIYRAKNCFPKKQAEASHFYFFFEHGSQKIKTISACTQVLINFTFFSKIIIS